MLAAVEDLRALAKKAGRAARKPDAPVEAAGRLRAFASLARWLQLQTLGDPESADTGLADELKGIYREAFPKAGKAGGLQPHGQYTMSVNLGWRRDSSSVNSCRNASS